MGKMRTLKLCTGGGKPQRTEEQIVHQELELNPPDPPVLKGTGKFRL